MLSEATEKLLTRILPDFSYATDLIIRDLNQSPGSTLGMRGSRKSCQDASSFGLNKMDSLGLDHSFLKFETLYVFLLKAQYPS
jgi:hypothetical protein